MFYEVESVTQNNFYKNFRVNGSKYDAILRNVIS